MKKNILYLLFGFFLLLGCDNYLDVVPEDDIATIESIFEKESSAMQYFYGCYLYYRNVGSVTTDPGLIGGDELITGQTMRSGTRSWKVLGIPTGFLSASDPILGRWKGTAGNDQEWNYYDCIRQCNVFIENIDKVYNMTEERKKKYKASAIAIKALYYFELVQMYGPITLVPENIDVEAEMEVMQRPRSHVDTCFNRIAELFDQAIELGIHTFAEQPQYEAGLLNRESVYAYKAKALLYAASPLFNGNPWYSDFTNRDGEPLFSSEYDESKWVRAAQAADEAVAFCEQRAKSLDQGYNQESSDLLNTIRDVQLSVLPIAFGSNELLHGMYSVMDGELVVYLPRYSSVDENRQTPVFRDQGIVNPSFRMVELFYTENGLPIEEDKNWNFVGRYHLGVESDYKYKNVVALNKSVLNLHLRREPRFYANIGFDGGIRRREDEYVELEAFRGGLNGFEKLSIDDPTVDRVNLTGYWLKKRVHWKNFASKTTSAINPVAPYPKMRLAEVYLMQAEANNEAYGPSDKVYEALDKIRIRAGIPPIREAWNLYAKNPATIDSKEGLKDVIRQERMIELCFEGQRFWDLRRWKIAHEYLSKPIKGWNIFGEKGAQFYNDFNGPIDVWFGNSFSAPRDYFWPLRNEDVLRSNIKQNPGW